MTHPREAVANRLFTRLLTRREANFDLHRKVDKKIRQQVQIICISMDVHKVLFACGNKKCISHGISHRNSHRPFLRPVTHLMS